MVLFEPLFKHVFIYRIPLTGSSHGAALVSNIISILLTTLISQFFLFYSGEFKIHSHRFITGCFYHCIISVLNNLPCRHFVWKWEWEHSSKCSIDLVFVGFHILYPLHVHMQWLIILLFIALLCKLFIFLEPAVPLHRPPTHCTHAPV